MRAKKSQADLGTKKLRSDPFKKSPPSSTLSREFFVAAALPRGGWFGEKGRLQKLIMSSFCRTEGKEDGEGKSRKWLDDE